MPPIAPSRLSRRALLQAGTALCSGWGAATLLVGCGGSTPPDDALPEGYSEAYRLNLAETEGKYAFARAVTVTPVGDLVLAVNTRTHNAETDTSSYGFRVSRYTKRAQPGLTKRSEQFPARTFSEETFGVVITDAAGRLYIPSYFVKGSSPPQIEDKTPADLTIFAPDGTQEGVVTFGSVADYRINGGRLVQLVAVSVSPSGDYYATVTAEDPSDESKCLSVIRWNRSGKLVGGYVGKAGFLDTGSTVSFLPDGTAYLSVYKDATKESGILPVSETGLGGFAPNGGAVGQTDAADNRYTVSVYQSRSHAVTRNQPTLHKENILKYSPTGMQLALIRLSSDERAGTSLAVDKDGTVFVVSGGEIIVYKRTR